MSYAFKDLHWARDIRVNEYLFPKTTAEALEMLAGYEGRARVVSGGTDIIPKLRKRELGKWRSLITLPVLMWARP